MSLSNDWRRVFPYEETVKVVNLIQQTWDGLVVSNVARFNPNSAEPHLTIFLKAVLKTKQSAEGLTGHFSSEEVDAEADLLTGTLKNRGRTDIRYVSDRIDVDLIFEFKKLKAKSDSRLSYYGKNGILRFVSGKYSRDRHLGFMVGLIAAEPEKCIKGLKEVLARPDVAAQLHLVKTADGAYVREPSRELPGKVLFDTEHSRLGNSRTSYSATCSCCMATQRSSLVRFRPKRNAARGRGNGLQKPSQIMVDKVATVSRDKLGPVFGHIDAEVMLEVERCLSVFLGIAK